MIEIKSHYGGWRPCTKEQARGFVRHLKHNMTAVREENKKALIQERLRGVSVEELLGEGQGDGEKAE